MIYWNPNPNFFTIPVLNWPIKWYGLLFALGFVIGFSIFEGILYRYFLLKDSIPQESEKSALGPGQSPNNRRSQVGSYCNDISSPKLKVGKITDRITIYLVVATIVGARLGHFLFYENPSEYLHNPVEILQTWNGGLASHGAAIAIVIALWLFSRWSKKIDSGLTLFRLLDFVCVPTALVGAFIRLGNFINQEILGTPTQMPWGVVFGHPADYSSSIPRHPVQLYEAVFYLAVFFLLWRLSSNRKFLQVKGGLIGLFLVLVFGFRFLIEFLKLEQSQLLSNSVLTMGQWLSIPLVIAGSLLLIFRKKIYTERT